MATLNLTLKDTVKQNVQSGLKNVDVLIEARKNHNELVEAMLSINEVLKDLKAKIDAHPDLAKSVDFNGERIEDIVKKTLPALEAKMGSNLRQVHGELKVDLNKNAERVIEQEGHSRRKNVIINGVPDPADGETEDTESEARKFLKQNLKLDNADSYILRDCHRLGAPKKQDGTPRNLPKPIIMAFVCQKDRNEVMRKAFELKGTPFSIKSDLPKELNDIRSKMLKYRGDMKNEQPGLKIRVTERGYKPVLQRGEGLIPNTTRTKWVNMVLPTE